MQIGERQAAQNRVASSVPEALCVPTQERPQLQYLHALTHDSLDTPGGTQWPGSLHFTRLRKTACHQFVAFLLACSSTGRLQWQGPRVSPDQDFHGCPRSFVDRMPASPL
jgi:hypothetical protein